MPPAAPSDLFVYLERLGIVTRTVAHAPVFTVAESRVIKAAIPGGHSKNLFLKDRKERLFLVVARDEARIDLKRLPEAIGASGRLSFGSADLLRSVLGVEPGSVTPFAVINDRGDGRVSVILDADLVSVILDADLMVLERVNVHPLVNTMTTTIASVDLIRFLRATGHEPCVLTLTEPASETGREAGASA